MTPLQIDQLDKLLRLKQANVLSEEEFVTEVSEVKEQVLSTRIKPSKEQTTVPEGHPFVSIQENILAYSSAIYTTLSRIEAYLTKDDLQEIEGDNREYLRLTSWRVYNHYHEDQNTEKTEEMKERKKYATLQAAFHTLAEVGIITDNEYMPLLKRLNDKAPECILSEIK